MSCEVGHVPSLEQKQWLVSRIEVASPFLTRSPPPPVTPLTNLLSPCQAHLVTSLPRLPSPPIPQLIFSLSHPLNSSLDPITSSRLPLVPLLNPLPESPSPSPLPLLPGPAPRVVRRPAERAPPAPPPCNNSRGVPWSKVPIIQGKRPPLPEGKGSTAPNLSSHLTGVESPTKEPFRPRSQPRAPCS